MPFTSLAPSSDAYRFANATASLIATSAGTSRVSSSCTATRSALRSTAPRRSAVQPCEAAGDARVELGRPRRRRPRRPRAPRGRSRPSYCEPIGCPRDPTGRAGTAPGASPAGGRASYAARSRSSSSVDVEYSPLANGSLASTSSARSRVVGTPSIVVSRRAPLRARDRARAVGVPDDQLRDQRVVDTAGSTTPLSRNVSTRTPGPCGALEARDRGPARARKSCSGSSAFSRTSIACPRRGARPVDRERLARGDEQLLAHDVDSGAELGHRMLDLQARVQLDEVEAAVGAEQELEGARRCGSRRPGRPARRRPPSPRAPRASARGDGDSSISFWWRRWIEHSRSPRVSTLPWWSQST